MMNTLLKLQYMAVGLLTATALLLQSCSNDESFDITGSPENVVYLNTQSFSPVGTPKNSFLFNVTNTPVSSTITYPNATSIAVKFPVQCTQVATEDVRVKFELDNSLVVEGFSALPDGVTATMDKTELVIPKGATISNDSITVSVDGDLQSLNSGNYVLPAAKITTVTGAKISANTNLSAAYVVIKAVFTNGTYSASAPGTVVSKNGLGWTATINGTNQPNIVDNSTSSYYNSGSSPAFPLTMVIDTKSARTIKGFQLRNYSASYAIREVNVYTSNADTPTDTDYVFQGRVALTSAAQQFIRFYNEVECRYVKVEILGGYNSSGQIVITDFNVYL
jgi:hypothetical protein